MEKITELIARLTAIENFCKDIHYTNVTYEDHLLADRIYDGISTHLDDIKEQMILAKRELPLSSKDYLQRTISFIPDINKDENRANWLRLRDLIETTLKHVNELNGSRAENALLDSIAQDLNTDLALIFIQTRRATAIHEEVAHDHEAATETPIDRKEFKQEEIEPSPAQKRTLKYDADNVLVAEESDTLDRVARKLGIV